MKNCFNAGKILCSVLVLGCMWLAGCGGETEENVTVRRELLCPDLIMY